MNHPKSNVILYPWGMRVASRKKPCQERDSCHSPSQARQANNHTHEAEGHTNAVAKQLHLGLYVVTCISNREAAPVHYRQYPYPSHSRILRRKQRRVARRYCQGLQGMIVRSTRVVRLPGRGGRWRKKCLLVGQRNTPCVDVCVCACVCVNISNGIYRIKFLSPY